MGDDEIPVDVGGEDPWFEEFEITLRTNRLGLLVLDAGLAIGCTKWTQDATNERLGLRQRLTGLSMAKFGDHIRTEIEDVIGSPEETARETGLGGVHMTEDAIPESFEIVDVQEDP